MLKKKGAIFFFHIIITKHTHAQGSCAPFFFSSPFSSVSVCFFGVLVYTQIVSSLFMRGVVGQPDSATPTAPPSLSRHTIDKSGAHFSAPKGVLSTIHNVQEAVLVLVLLVDRGH